jgi:leucyl/phenylalanyl-tRNA--protein transferase
MIAEPWAVPICEEDDEPPFWLPPHLGDESGLIGVGGNLKPATLLMAYRAGVFPWYSEGEPILWFSPEPRGIIPLDQFHIAKRLARTLRQGQFNTTINRCFRDVMTACGENRGDRRWITDEMLEAYCTLYQLGHAHSVEVWQGDSLVGGTYGVAINGLFAAESMFHRITDASKVALVTLAERLQSRGYQLLDIQMVTPHTATFGAIEIARRDYLSRVQLALACPATFT